MSKQIELYTQVYFESAFKPSSEWKEENKLVGFIDQSDFRKFAKAAHNNKNCSSYYGIAKVRDKNNPEKFINRAFITSVKQQSIEDQALEASNEWEKNARMRCMPGKQI